MTTQRPFRFGTGIMPVASRAEWVAAARDVEARGFSTFLLPDHFEAHWFPPLTALMSAADATTTLRVGTIVLNNDFRNPALLAREAATLDLLSDGRFELGIGAGDAEADYTKSGLRFDRPGMRVGRLEEAVHIIKSFFHEETVTFQGEHYTMSGLPAAPKPVQRPHPPLLIAGAGPRMLSFAAREADIVGLLFRGDGSRLYIADGSLANAERRVEAIKAAASARFADMELNTLVFNVVITDDRKRAADDVARQWGCTPAELLDTIHVLIGSVDHITEQIRMWRERTGVSYLIFGGAEATRAMTPIVERLAGT